MTTIRDVAKQANVSVATVSRVLNKSEKVSTETKQRVEDVIKLLGYQPNDIARSLFKGKSKMIALLVPSIMNPFFPELARAAEDVANKYGYTFVLCNTDDDAEKERAYLNGLRQKSVDGIIIVSSTFTRESLRDVHVPLIVLDRQVSSDTPAITVNNRNGARQAVQHLRDIGCKKIAHIQGPDNTSNARLRLQGYLDVVKNEDWYDPSLVDSGHYHTEEAYHATVRLMKSHPDIDGIFAANDLMGVGVLRAAADLGISVPTQLAVIGFDGIDLGNSTMPTLSSMAQPIYKVGSHAAEMLIEHIKDNTTNRFIEAVEYNVTLTKRGSTERGYNHDQ